MYLHWLMYWMDLRRNLKIQDQSMTALCSMMVTCGGDFLYNIYFCASDKQNVCDKKGGELKELIVGKEKLLFGQDIVFFLLSLQDLKKIMKLLFSLISSNYAIGCENIQEVCN